MRSHSRFTLYVVHVSAVAYVWFDASHHITSHQTYFETKRPNVWMKTNSCMWDNKYKHSYRIGIPHAHLYGNAHIHLRGMMLSTCVLPCFILFVVSLAPHSVPGIFLLYCILRCFVHHTLNKMRMLCNERVRLIARSPCFLAGSSKRARARAYLLQSHIC